MTIIYITIGILIGLVMGFLIANFKNSNQPVKTNIVEGNAHQKPEYSSPENDIKFNTWQARELSLISDVIPQFKNKEILLSFLKEYLYSKNDFKTSFINADFLKRYNIENASNPKQDGVWIKGNEFIDQERGYIHRSWKITSNQKAVNLFCDLLWRNINLK